MATRLFIGSHNVLELQDLTDTVDDSEETGATVTATITDNGGNEITGETWPVTLSNVSGGLYRAIIDSAADLRENRKYTITYTVETTGGTDAIFKCEDIEPEYLCA